LNFKTHKITKQKENKKKTKRKQKENKKKTKRKQKNKGKLPICFYLGDVIN
jgi:hypothetical protein